MIMGSSLGAGFVYSTKVLPWRKVFLWVPTNVKGKSRWLTHVYVRETVYREDMDFHSTYEYGNLFDVLKDD